MVWLPFVDEDGVRLELPPGHKSAPARCICNRLIGFQSKHWAGKA